MPVGHLCYTVHADSYLRIEKPKKHVAYGRLFTLGSFYRFLCCMVSKGPVGQGSLQLYDSFSLSQTPRFGVSCYDQRTSL